jgi:hypothetical protein
VTRRNVVAAFIGAFIALLVGPAKPAADAGTVDTIVVQVNYANGANVAAARAAVNAAIVKAGRDVPGVVSVEIP